MDFRNIDLFGSTKLIFLAHPEQYKDRIMTKGSLRRRKSFEKKIGQKAVLGIFWKF